MEEKYEELTYALNTLWVCKTMMDAGRWTNADIRWSLDYDDFYEAIQTALGECCENVYGGYREYDETESIYFSDPCMLEFYRLCRVYSRREKQRLDDNPYIQKARQFVRNRLSGSYSAYYILHEKVNHKGAAGIHFMYDCYFEGELELLTAMLEIMDFYRKAVTELKAVLSPDAKAVAA